MNIINLTLKKQFMKIFAILITSIASLLLMYLCLHFASGASKDNFFKLIAFVSFWCVFFQSQKLIRFLLDAE